MNKVNDITDIYKEKMNALSLSHSIAARISNVSVFLLTICLKMTLLTKEYLLINHFHYIREGFNINKSVDIQILAESF